MMPSHRDQDSFWLQMQSRLAAGADNYKDRPADNRPPQQLLAELLQELEDAAVWSMLLWIRLRGLSAGIEKMEADRGN